MDVVGSNPIGGAFVTPEMRKKCLLARLLSMDTQFFVDLLEALSDYSALKAIVLSAMTDGEWLEYCEKIMVP